MVAMSPPVLTYHHPQQCSRHRGWHGAGGWWCWPSPCWPAWPWPWASWRHGAGGRRRGLGEQDPLAQDSPPTPPTVLQPVCPPLGKPSRPAGSQQCNTTCAAPTAAAPPRPRVSVPVSSCPHAPCPPIPMHHIPLHCALLSPCRPPRPSATLPGAIPMPVPVPGGVPAVMPPAVPRGASGDTSGDASGAIAPSPQSTAWASARS